MSAQDVQTPGGNRASTQQSEQSAEIIGDVTPLHKYRSRIAAELAIAGYALHQLESGAFLICRWDRTSFAPDLRAAQAFLDRVKGIR